MILCWYVFKAGELNHWKIQKNMNTLLCSHMFWALKSCLSSIARWKRQKTYMGMAAMLEHQMTSMFIFLIFQCASVDKRSNHWNTQKYEHGSHVRTSMVSMFIFLKFPMVHISPIQFNGQIHPPWTIVTFKKINFFVPVTRIWWMVTMWKVLECSKRWRLADFLTEVHIFI